MSKGDLERRSNRSAILFLIRHNSGLCARIWLDSIGKHRHVGRLSMKGSGKGSIIVLLLTLAALCVAAINLDGSLKRLANGDE